MMNENDSIVMLKKKEKNKCENEFKWNTNEIKINQN